MSLVGIEQVLLQREDPDKRDAPPSGIFRSLFARYLFIESLRRRVPVDGTKELQASSVTATGRRIVLTWEPEPGQMARTPVEK
jgi:hypothetical protein